jgi:hypothetical protein
MGRGLRAVGTAGGAAIRFLISVIKAIGRVDRDTVSSAIEARREEAPSPASSKLADAVRQFTSEQLASWSNTPQAPTTIRGRSLWRTVKCLGDLLRALLVDTPPREAGSCQDRWSRPGTGAVGPRTATTPSSRRRHAGSSGGCALAGMPPSRSPAGHRRRRLSACLHRPIGRTSVTEERHSGPPVWMN